MDPEDGIHGLEVHIDKNGVLGFNIRAQGDASVYGSGRDMFISMMQRLEKDGVAVNKIRGYWMSGTDSVNYQQFVQNASSLGKVKAAQQTWTGKIASDYGFTNVESIKESFGNITVIFGK
jgi:filamentous hemagglutinin